MVRARRAEEEVEVDMEAEDQEEDGEEVAGLVNNLRIEKAGTEEDSEEGIAYALEMEEEVDSESKGEEGGGGNQRALEALEFLTQEAEPSGTAIVDARNGFNELSRLAMLWTVQHR